MTKEQKDKILKALVKDRNDYARECENRITAEQGKIIGADYMLQRFLDVLSEPLEIKTVTNAKEAEAYPINDDVKRGFEEFTRMIFKQGEAESESRQNDKRII